MQDRANVISEFLSPQDIARRLNVSAATVRRQFGREPGVITMGKAPGRYGRTHRTIRIPVAVFERWLRQHEIPSSVRKPGL